MSKLLIEHEWYVRLNPEALYEEMFCKQLEYQGKHLFPGRTFVPFSCDVISPGMGTKRADYALIDDNYRDWWVVEVEMEYHSLFNHVAPQVHILAEGRYGRDHAKAIFAKSPTIFDEQRLTSLICTHQPRVLVPVLANAELPGWITVLQPMGALVVFFELYRASSGKGMFRLSGELPQDLGSLISRCTIHDQIMRALVVKTPSALTGTHGDILRLRFDGGDTSWIYTPLADTLMLFPKGRSPLPPLLTDYMLYREESGELELRPNTPPRKPQ